MTDLVVNNVVREVIVGTGVSSHDLLIGGVVREIVVQQAAATHDLNVYGLVREVLLTSLTGGDGAIDDRITEDAQDRVTQADDDRVIEQAIVTNGVLTATLQPLAVVATGLGVGPISGVLTATLQPLTLTAVADKSVAERITEDDQDRITEDDSGERVLEQYLEGAARLEVTLQPLTLAATARGGISAILEGVYHRVTETSPSSLHPALGGDVVDPAPGGELLHRVTERSGERVPGEVDHRILQHQLLATLRLSAEATLRSHVGERHFLVASRQRIVCAAARRRIVINARSDFRKTRPFVASDSWRVTEDDQDERITAERDERVGERPATEWQSPRHEFKPRAA